MDTVRWFRSEARSFLKAIRSGEPRALYRYYSVCGRASEVRLQKAQHVIAVEANFSQWATMLQASELEQRLAIEMLKEPLLSNHGIGLYYEHRRKSYDEQERLLKKDRQKLIDCIDDIAWTKQWLEENIARIKTINRRRSSYGLKHIAERHSPSGYISNGTLIAAGLIAEYPYKIRGSVALFGMSERSVKEVERRPVPKWRSRSV